MWYSARMVLECVITEPDYENPLFEEVIVLIEAADDDAAMQEARKAGIAAEHSYRNDKNEEVRWRMVEIAEIQALCESAVYSGMQVFSRLYRRRLDQRDDAGPEQGSPDRGFPR